MSAMPLKLAIFLVQATAYSHASAMLHLSGTILQYFISLPALWTLCATFKAKDKVRGASASTTLASSFRPSHNAYTKNYHLWAVEKGV